MSYSGTTSGDLQLPQWVGTDQATWEDINTAFSRIASAHQNVLTSVSSVVNTANSALQAANNASGKVGDLSELSTIDKGDVVEAVNEVNRNLVDRGGDLLWQTDGAFVSGRAYIASDALWSNYDYVTILFNGYGLSGNTERLDVTPMGTATLHSAIVAYPNLNVLTRGITFTHDPVNGDSFYAETGMMAATGVSTITESNNACIPIAIIGMHNTFVSNS